MYEQNHTKQTSIRNTSFVYLLLLYVILSALDLLGCKCLRVSSRDSASSLACFCYVSLIILQLNILSIPGRYWPYASTFAYTITTFVLSSSLCLPALMQLMINNIVIAFLCAFLCNLQMIAQMGVSSYHSALGIDHSTNILPMRESSMHLQFAFSNVLAKPVSPIQMQSDIAACHGPQAWYAFIRRTPSRPRRLLTKS